MKVLIVDDEVYAVNALINRVDWAGYGFDKPLSAHSMAQAQSVFMAVPVDLLLCDIEMPQGSGLSVTVNNVSWCTPDMYRNAFTTAGITDARITVAAPFPVSGTAALAGIYKAYEDMTGQKLDTAVKDVGTQELTVTGTEGEWTACTIDGESGYVSSEFVLLNQTGSSQSSAAAEEKPPVKTKDPGYITGNNVRFRQAADPNSGLIGELFYGNAVTITGVKDDWTEIVYEGKTGFVYSQYVTKGELQKTATGGTATGRQIVDFALQYVGYNYRWGGMDPNTGFDCSGFTSYVYKQFGYELNRVACDQARNGVHVDANKLQPGDILCFYSSGSYIGHVGLYIGDGKFVHAANSSSGVIISELSGYYAARGYEARRIL